MNIANYCSNRKFRFLYNVPPARLNIVSPYDSYTQFDLDMRRKAEILKYNTSTTQGTMTKTQKWGRIVKTSVSSSISSSISSTKNSTNVNCPLDDLIKTPTSSCGVPGPVILLYNDPNVPLYNYQSNTDAYSLLETQINTDPFNIDGIIQNETYNQTLPNFLCVLKIFDIVSASTNFEIVIPITLKINYTLIDPDLTGNIKLSIDIPDLIVTYTNISDNLYPPALSSANFFDLNKKNINISVDGNSNFPPYNNTLSQTYYEFSFLIKYGNISLHTASGYIYSLLLSNENPIYRVNSTENVSNYSVSFILNSDTNPTMYMGVAPLTDGVSMV